MSFKDFRAARVQTQRLITSGANPVSGALLMFYSTRSEDPLFPNQGTLNPSFGNHYRGRDIFLYVSGAIGSLNGNTNGAAVFGGDVFISGNLSINGSSPTGGGGGADPSASYVLVNATASLPNEFVLAAGSNISIVQGAGIVTINGPAGVADPDAQYLVLVPTGSLSNERFVSMGLGLSASDGGAGGAWTISAPAFSASFIVIGGSDARLPNERFLQAGQGITLIDNGSGSSLQIQTEQVYVPNTPTFVTLTNTSDLANERRLLVGTHLQITDSGAGASVTIGSNLLVSVSNASFITVSGASSLSGSRFLNAGGGIQFEDNGAGSSFTISVLTGSSYANYHNNSYGPIALYQFSGSLSESISNNHLIVITGSQRYTDLSPGLRGFTFDGLTGLATSASIPELQITGALTVEFICNVPPFSSSFNQSIFQISDFGDDNGSENNLGKLVFGNFGQILYQAEKDLGVDIDYTTTNTIPFSELMHFAVTRAGDTGALKFYINGRLLETTASTDLPNTGSVDLATSRLQVGYEDDGTWTQGVSFAKNLGIASLKIFNIELQPNEINSEFNYTLGPLYKIFLPESGDSSDSNASYLVLSNTGSLTNERRLTTHDGILAIDGGAGSNFRISAPFVSASFLIITTTGTLPNQRTLSAGPGINITDNGAGSTLIIGSDAGAAFADISASFIVINTTASLPNERALVAGTGIQFTDGGAGNSLTITCTLSNSQGAADISASYLVIGNTASLPNERRVVGQAGVTLTDGGAGGALIFSTPFVSSTFITLTATSLLPNERTFTVESPLVISDSGAGGNLTLRFEGTASFAPISASYLVVGLTSALPNERRVIGLDGVSIVDQGAGGNILFSSSMNVSSALIVLGGVGNWPNQRTLSAGTGIFLTDTGPGNQIIISVSSSDISTDPSASYIVVGNTASLPNERRLVADPPITLTDFGAGSTINIGFNGDLAYADISASYLVIGNTASLVNERQLSASTGINLTDGGANGIASLSINNSVVATITGSRFSGRVWASGGLSGSLQEVSPGIPYLLAGDGIQIVTNSLGQIEITSAGALFTKKQFVAAKRTTNSQIPLMIGQFAWVPSDYSAVTNLVVRTIMSTDATIGYTGSLQIYNLTSGSFVDLKENNDKYFKIQSGTPTLITSSNLYMDGTNFNTSSTNIYEIRLSGSGPHSVTVGSVELVYI